MSLAEEASAGPPQPKKKLSKIPAWLESLGPEDRAAAERVMADPAWQHVEVRALFARHGLTISPQVIGEYRKEHYGSR